MEKGFYTLSSNELLYAPNSIYIKDVTLTAQEKDTYTYPVYGWYWFDTKQQALDHFGIVEEELNNNL